MNTENKLRLVDVWVGVRDSRYATKVEHDLVELMVVSVSAVLFGADSAFASTGVGSCWRAAWRCSPPPGKRGQR